MEPDSDVGARVRAAREYARLDAAGLAKKVQAAGFKFSRRTLDRLEAGERPLDVREAQIIATACDVPLTFLVRGWWSPPDLVERVAAHDERLSLAERERDALRRTVAVLGTLLRDRLGIDVEEALARDSEQGDADAPTGEEGRPTP